MGMGMESHPFIESRSVVSSLIVKTLCSFIIIIFIYKTRKIAITHLSNSTNN